MGRVPLGKVVACTLATVLCMAMSSGAFDRNSYGLRYPYNSGYLVFPGDGGSHPGLSLLGGAEWWGLFGQLGDASGNLYTVNAKFHNLMFPWIDTTGGTLGFDMPEMFTFGVGDLTNKEHTAYHTGISISGAQMDDDFLDVSWTTGSIRTIGDFKYEGHFEDPGNDVTLDATFEAEAYPIPLGWDGTVRYTWTTDIWGYTIPRLRAEGTLWKGGVPHKVQGAFFLDHVWFPTSVLDNLELLGTRKNVDWFAIRLSNGMDVVLWKVNFDGTQPPYIPAVNIRYPDGTQLFYDQRQSAPEMMPAVENLGYYRSARTGNIYSYGWHVSLPEQQIDLTLYPYQTDQELAGSYLTADLSTYTGHCSVSGIAGKGPVTGFASVETTTKHVLALTPNPPSGMEAASISKTVVGASLALHWEANPEADIAGYNIYYGQESRHYFQPPIDVPNLTDYVVQLTGLDSSKPVYVALTAVDNNGIEGFYSEELVVKPKSRPEVSFKVAVDLPCFMERDTMHLSLALGNEGNPAIPVDMYLGIEGAGEFFYLSGNPGAPVLTAASAAGSNPPKYHFWLPGRFDAEFVMFDIPLAVPLAPAQYTLYGALVDTDTGDVLEISSTRFCLN